MLQFVAFLERLSRTLNMDELTQDIGIELHTDAIIHRAEQLARLESDKIVDKVSDWTILDILDTKTKCFRIFERRGWIQCGHWDHRS